MIPLIVPDGRDPGPDRLAVTDFLGMPPAGLPDRIGVMGDDALLARVARHISDAGADNSIAFGGRSSLLRMFALGGSARDVQDRLRHGTPYPCDLGWVDRGGIRMPFIGGVGAGGAAHPGFFPFRRAGPVDCRVDTEERRVEARARAVVVANSQHWGPWLVAPRAAVMDGRVDVQLVTGSRLGALALRRPLTRGTHLRSRSVRRLQARRGSVECPGAWPVRVDGRPWGTGSFRFGVQPAAVLLLV